MRNFTVLFFLFFTLLIVTYTFAQSPVTLPGFTNACVSTGDVGWSNPVTVNTILVFAKANTAVTVGTPAANISTYTTASTDFSSPGTPYENDASAFLVYKNTGSSVSLTGLNPGVTYHFLIYNANGATYSTAAATSGATLSAPNNAGSFASGAPTNSTTGLSWANPLPTGCVDEVLIVGKLGSSVSGSPTGGAAAYPTAGVNFSTAIAPDFDAAAKVLYKGPSATLTITNLLGNTTYFFKIFTRKGTLWSTGSEISMTTKLDPASLGSFTGTCLTTGTANWTDPASPSTILVFAKAVSAITFGTPTANISTYASVSTNLASPGTAYQNDASAFLVFKGTAGAPVNLTGLAANTNYHFLVLNATGTNYSTAEIFNGSTPAAPNNATSFGVVVGGGFLNLSWTNPLACLNQVLVVGHAVSAVTAVPSGSGGAYTASTVFGSGTDIGTNEFVVYKGTGNSVVVTGLTNGTTYHFTVFVESNSVWSSGTSTTGVPIDITPPAVTLLSPLDDAINVATNVTLTLTFDEPIAKATDGTVTANDTDILINHGATTEFTIGRAALTIGGNTATITLPSPLSLNNTLYHVIIGNKVIKDIAGNNYVGIATNSAWNFTTSNGVTVSTGGATANTSTFTTLSNIVLTENGNNDFAVGTNKSLKFAFNGGGYIFDATVLPTLSFGSNNITAATAIMDFTSVTITYTVTGTDKLDVLTISGLKVKTSSTSNPTVTIQRVAGASDGTITNAPVGTTLGSVTSCSTAAPVLVTSGGDANVCLGGSFAGLSIQATGAGSIRWYNDAGLTSEIVTLAGNNNPSVAALGITNTPIGTQTRYATLTSGCQSGGAPVDINITSLPAGNAGVDLTGGTAICPGTPVTLGGSPTLATATTPPPYTFTWSEPSGFIGGFSAANTSNPVVPGSSITNPGGATRNYTFRVVITDAFGCSSAPDDVIISVKDLAQSVTITSPTQFSFADSDDPITLTGNPSGGIFSGPGVVLQGGPPPPVYKFDPNVASINGSPHTVSYTVTIANGCSKTITQQFTVSSGSFVIPELPVNQFYCGNEANSGVLHINPSYQSILTSFGYYLVRFESDLGGLVGIPSTAPVPVLTQQFSPAAAAFGRTTPTQFRIYAVIRPVANPPGVGEFRWVSDIVTVNPIPNVFFSGLNSGVPANPNDFCRSSATFQLTGNFTGGSFLSSDDNGVTYAPQSGLVDSNPGPGKALFNPATTWTNAPGAGNKTIYVQYTFDPGTIGSSNQACKNQTSQIIRINTLPTIALTAAPATGTVFCNGDAAVVLQADQTVRTTLTGQGVSDQGGGKGTFSPNAAFKLREQELNTVPLTIFQPFTIFATYTDALGCKATDFRNVKVQPIPPASFNFFGKVNYCKGDGSGATTFLGGQPNGRYFLQFAGFPAADSTVGTKDLVFDADKLFKQAQFHGASSLSTVNITVVYTASDPVATSCINTMTQLFRISPNLPVTIAGIDDKSVKIYCSNEGPFTLTVTPPNGNLTINPNNTSYGPAETLTNNGSRFVFDRPSGGQYDLKYDVVTGAGCTNSTIVSTRLIPSPTSSFNIPPQCDGNTISFTSLDNTSAVFSKWDFGDSSPLDSSAFSTTHKYPVPSQYHVVLELRAAKDIASGRTCKSIIAHDITVGPIPRGAVALSKVCEGDPTSLVASSPNIGLSTVAWNFGDGVIIPMAPTNFAASAIPFGVYAGTTGTYGSPIHQYAAQGTYNSVMTGRTDPTLGACQTIVPKKISILKNIVADTGNPYLMASLNGGDGFWQVEDGGDSTTWVFGIPTGKDLIQSASKVWITKATGHYKALDNSYVNSPCFNLSGFAKPAVSLDYWVNADARKDGAVLQYTLTGGPPWTTIGNTSSGVDWYNVPFISSAPGGANVFGWSDTGTGFVNGKHDISFLIQPKVRFRIAFASDERIESDGFSFRNLKIEDRNRISLAENFTNEKSPKLIANNTGFIALTSAETISLQVNTSFPGPDPVNALNPADHNARAAFYGLTNSLNNVPLGFVDGFSGGDFTAFIANPTLPPGSLPPAWVTTATQLRSLVASPFTITINNPTGPANALSVQVSIKALANIGNRKLGVFVAIIEKQTGIYKNVVRKLLPSAAGTMLTTPMAQNTVVNLPTMSWNATPGVNLSELAIVAFVQDLDVDALGRREVFQAAILASPSNKPTVVTGMENNIGSVAFYPIPADRQLEIRLVQPAKNNVPVLIYDAVGKPVLSTSIESGNQSKTVNTNEWASGIYIVEMQSDLGTVRKKVMIVHGQ